MLFRSKERAEVMLLKLRNESEEKKEIRTVGAVEWCLWNAWDDFTNFQRNYSTGEVEIEDKAIYHKTEYRERRDHYAFFSVNEKVTGYDSDRATFLGRFNGWDSPASITDGKMGSSHASGWSPIAALENSVPSDVLAVADFHIEVGNNGKGHIFKQPQLQRAGGNDRTGETFTHIFIQQGCPLLEQFRAAIVHAELMFTIGTVGVDRFGIVPDCLQQGIVVDLCQK